MNVYYKKKQKTYLIGNATLFKCRLLFQRHASRWSDPSIPTGPQPNIPGCRLHFLLPLCLLCAAHLRPTDGRRLAVVLLTRPQIRSSLLFFFFFAAGSWKRRDVLNEIPILFFLSAQLAATFADVRPGDRDVNTPACAPDRSRGQSTTPPDSGCP